MLSAGAEGLVRFCGAMFRALVAVDTVVEVIVLDLQHMAALAATGLCNATAVARMPVKTAVPKFI